MHGRNCIFLLFQNHFYHLPQPSSLRCRMCSHTMHLSISFYLKCYFSQHLPKRLPSRMMHNVLSATFCWIWSLITTKNMFLRVTQCLTAKRFSGTTKYFLKYFSWCYFVKPTNSEGYYLRHNYGHVLNHIHCVLPVLWLRLCCVIRHNYI